MRILFTGGGSGGHVFPLIAIIREIRVIYREKDLELFYLGPKEDEFGSILLSQEGVIVKKIWAGKLRRYFSFKNILDILFKLPLGFLQSFFYLFFVIRPDFIFSKGGYGSLPATICAKILGKPFFIHESDTVPGLSNRISSKWAKKIFTSFPKTEYFPAEKTTLVGNPIRAELLNGSKEKARDLLGLTMKKPAIFFLGGSQGAQFINDFVLGLLNRILEKYEVVHQCGRENLESVKAESQAIIKKDLEKYYHPVGFLKEEELKHIYQAADLIISRSGSGSIFEIAAAGKPSILVPLPLAAADHQVKNAYSFAQDKACLIMEEKNLTPSFFLEKLNYLFFIQPQDLENMKNQAIKFSKPLAARAIARYVLEYLMLT